MNGILLSDAVRRGSQNNFNAIRIFAAVSVLFGHAYPIMGVSDPTSRFFGGIHYIGDMAVDIFFITSGFLLAKSILTKHDFVSFVFARIIRIYPALIVCNIITILICAIVFSDNIAAFILSPEAITYFMNNTLMLNNWVIYKLPGVFSGVHIENVNGSLWTLPAEIKAYIIMIITIGMSMIIVRKYTPYFLPVMWVGVLLWAIFSYDTMPFVGTEPMFRRLIIYFFLGALFYAVRDMIILDLRMAGVLFVAIIVFRRDEFILPILTYIAYPYLVLTVAYATKHIDWFDKNDFSYGIYIYGWFCQNFIAWYFVNPHPLIVFSGGALLSSILAYLSWHYVEKPILQLKKKKAIAV